MGFFIYTIYITLSRQFLLFRALILSNAPLITLYLKTHENSPIGLDTNTYANQKFSGTQKVLP